MLKFTLLLGLLLWVGLRRPLKSLTLAPTSLERPCVIILFSHFSFPSISNDISTLSFNLAFLNPQLSLSLIPIHSRLRIQYNNNNPNSFLHLHPFLISKPNTMASNADSNSANNSDGPASQDVRFGFECLRNIKDGKVRRTPTTHTKAEHHN